MESDVATSQEFRDSVFRTLKHEAENLTCFQCGNKNPKWASVTMGLLICYNCTSFHRSLGTHLSFVRSADLDKWSRRQLAFMELGGNKRAKEFFRKHGSGANVDFSSSLAERYRVELEEKVSQLYPKRKEENPVLEHSNPSPVPIVETAKSEVPVLTLDPLPTKPQVPMSTELRKTPVIHVAPVIPQATPTYKFRKTKTAAAPVQFKAVVFHPEEEDEFQECNPTASASSSASPGPVASSVTAIQRPNPEPIKGPSVPQVKPVAKISEKKSFSSEDFQRAEDAYVIKERLSHFSTSKAISSDAYFGRESESHSEQPTFEDEASRLADLASEKAHELKEKAIGFYHSLASRFA